MRNWAERATRPAYLLSDAVRHWAQARAWTADRALGRRGEDLTHRHLRRQGFIVVGRNWKTRSASAEVDLIAWDGDDLVFVEVKTRATESAQFGPPERAVDRVKQERLLRAATEYCRRTEVGGERVRFDVVSVVLGDPPRLRHFRDVF